MKDLNELQVFAAVAREGSFTRAAAALELSKAAVSRAVMALETRLGARLFERNTRRLMLTEAGETFLVHARRALDTVQEGEAAVSELTSTPRGTLRVALPVTLARASVAPALAGFLQRYPELRIDMTLRGGQIDPIAARVDVVLQTARPATDSDIIQRRLAVVEFGVFAAEAYLETARPLQAPQDLQQHSCIIMSDGSNGTTWTLRNDGHAEEVHVRGPVSVGDPVVHHQLCLDAVGVAVLPLWLADDSVRTQRLLRVIPEWTPAPIELYALYPTRLSLTPKVSAFLDFVESVVPGSRRSNLSHEGHGKRTSSHGAVIAGAD